MAIFVCFKTKMRLLSESDSYASVNTVISCDASEQLGACSPKSMYFLKGTFFLVSLRIIHPPICDHRFYFYHTIYCNRERECVTKQVMKSIHFIFKINACAFPPCYDNITVYRSNLTLSSNNLLRLLIGGTVFVHYETNFQNRGGTGSKDFFLH